MVLRHAFAWFEPTEPTPPPRLLEFPSCSPELCICLRQSNAVEKQNRQNKLDVVNRSRRTAMTARLPGSFDPAYWTSPRKLIRFTSALRNILTRSFTLRLKLNKS